MTSRIRNAGVGRLRLLCIVLLALAMLTTAACDRLSNDPDVLVEEARLALQQQEPERGLILLKKAVELRPEHDATRMLLAEYYLELNQAENADIQLQRIPARVQDDNYFALRARALAWLERYDEIIGLTPPDFTDQEARLDFNRYRIDALIATGRMSAAQALIDERRLAGDAEDWVCVREASLGFANSELDKAWQRLLACEEAAAGDSDYWILRSSVEQFQRLFAYAVSSLHRAVALEQRPAYLTRNRVHAGMNLAVLHIRLGNFRTAREELRKIGPTTFPVMWHYVNAQLAIQAGDHERANSELVNLFRINPDYPLGIALMQQVKYRLGQTAQAREFVNKGVTAQLEFSRREFSRQELHLALARAFTSHEDHEQALRELAQVESASVDLLLFREQVSARQDGRPLALERLRALESAHREFAEQKRLLRFYLTANIPDDAERLFRALLPSPRADGELIELRARTLLQEGRLQEAGRFIDSQMANHAALLIRHKAEHIGRTRGIDAAIEYLRREAPRGREFSLMLAELEARAGDPGAALEVLRRLERAEGDDPGLMLRVAEMAMRAGQHRLAAERYRQVLARVPHEAALFVNLARAELALDEHAAARRHMAQALMVQEDHVGALRLWLAFEVERDGGAALALLDEYAPNLRDKEDAVVLRGWLHEQLQKPREAEAIYEAALRENPLSRKILPRQVALREQAGGIEAVDAWLRQTAATHNDDYPLLLLAEFHSRQQDHQRASDLYQELLSRQDDNPVVLNNIAWSLYQLGDLAQAVAYAGRAVERLPGNASILDTYGWLLVQSGDTREGLGHLRDAYWRLAGNRTVGWHLAAALARDGQRAEARRQLERLLKDPEDFPERAAADALLKELTGPA